VKDFLVFNDIGASTNQVSNQIALGDLDRYSIEVQFSDAASAGTLSLECRNEDLSTTEWKTVLNSSQVVAAGAAHMWNVEDAQYQFVRVRWVRTAGAGVMRAYAVVKENRVKEG
jgi:hypothetical protein